MNKKDLINKATEVLRNNNIRKPISTPKQVFHISDDEGNHKDFTVKKTDKSVAFNTNDVALVLNALLVVIEESIKHGEEVCIHGFGTLDVHQRAARTTKHPCTGETVEVKARYVPRFSFGNNLRIAAKLYELSLADTHREFPQADEEDDI
mgnify:CR=1 FL=1